MTPEVEAAIAAGIRRRDVKSLVQWAFGYTLASGQEQIVRSILYPEHKRICINAMTRYGKSRAMSFGVGLYIIFHKNKKIALIAPTGDQAEIIRNYIAELVVTCPILSALVDIDLAGIGVGRLNREASRKRLTFKNGCELRVFSAEGEADRLMGFGANGLVIIDEACLIKKPEVWAKISRMLGDAPEDCKLIELSNPWDMATQYYKDWTSGKFHCIHIGYTKAIDEGRTTKEFVEEQRGRLLPMEFTVLYESQFPAQADDAMFNYDKILAATKPHFEFKHVEASIIGADIADKGLDSTVIIHAHMADGYYIIQSIYSEAKSENTAVAGRIIQMHEEKSADVINIDTIGVGTGVVSMVKEGKRFSRAKVTGCHFGEAASDPKRFMNKKAENYFRLNDLFNQGKIQIPHDERLIRDLLGIKWEYSSKGQIRIVDPEKSPDYADALVYTIWNSAKRGFSIA